MRTEARPRGEGISIAELRPVGSHLRQQGVSGEGVNGGNGGYVHSENTIQFATHVKAKLILARSVRMGFGRQGGRVRRKVAIEVLQLFLNLFVARGHQALIITKSFQRLTQGEKVLPPV